MSFVPSKYIDNLITSYHLHCDHTAVSHHRLSPGPTKQLPDLPASFPAHPPIPTLIDGALATVYSSHGIQSDPL